MASTSSRDLHKAASAADSELLTRILNDAPGSIVSKPDKNGKVAIHLAAGSGSAKCFELLVNAGANPEAACPAGRTAMHYAAMTGGAPAVEAICAASTPAQLVSKSDRQGNTPLHLATQEGNFAAVRALLAAGASVAVRNDEGVSPLHNAARGGFHDSVELLLQQSGVSRMIGTTDRNKRTPIMEASAGAHADVVRLLCEAKAKPTEACVVQAAGHKDGAETLGILLGEMEEDAQDQIMLKGWPAETDLAMSVAAERGYTRNIKELLKFASGPTKMKTKMAMLRNTNRDGLTPLHAALVAGHWSAALELLHAGSSTKVSAENGEALIFALVPDTTPTFICHAVMQRYLGELGDLDVLNSKGETALTAAIMAGGRVDLVNILLACGSDVNGADVNGERSVSVDSPLVAAVRTDQIAVVETLLAMNSVLRCIDVDDEDSKGDSALCIADRQGKVEICDVLLRYGATPLVTSSSPTGSAIRSKPKKRPSVRFAECSEVVLLESSGAAADNTAAIEGEEGCNIPTRGVSPPPAPPHPSLTPEAMGSGLLVVKPDPTESSGQVGGLESSTTPEVSVARAAAETVGLGAAEAAAAAAESAAEVTAGLNAEIERLRAENERLRRSQDEQRKRDAQARATKQPTEEDLSHRALLEEAHDMARMMAGIPKGAVAKAKEKAKAEAKARAAAEDKARAAAEAKRMKAAANAKIKAKARAEAARVLEPDNIEVYDHPDQVAWR